MFSKTKVTAERRSTSTLCLDVAKHIAIAFSIVDKATTVSRGRDDVEMLIVACLPRRCRAIDCRVFAARCRSQALCFDVAKHIAIAFSIVDKATTVSSSTFGVNS
jgi:hypothetical protein